MPQRKTDSTSSVSMVVVAVPRLKGWDEGDQDVRDFQSLLQSLVLQLPPAGLVTFTAVASEYASVVRLMTDTTDAEQEAVDELRRQMTDALATVILAAGSRKDSPSFVALVAALVETFLTTITNVYRAAQRTYLQDNAPNTPEAQDLANSIGMLSRLWDRVNLHEAKTADPRAN